MWEAPSRRWSLVTGPAIEPVSVAEAVTHLRGDDNNVLVEADLVEALIQAARGHVERVTGRQLITATWRLKLDRFPWWREPVELPMPPLLTVVSVKYRDSADVLQTWATSEYVVDAPAGPHAPAGRIYPALNKEYPTTGDRPDAVEVEFTAGYGANPESVPQELRQAMLLLIGHWYENREAVLLDATPVEVPFAVEALLGSFTQLAPLIR